MSTTRQERKPLFDYEEKVFMAWQIACLKNKGGASAVDVMTVMQERGWLSDMDTVIDIADLMKQIHAKGWL